MRTQAIALLLVIGSVAATGADVMLKVGDTRGAAGAEAEVPILISGSQKVGPIQFLLNYDPRMLEPVADGVVFGKVVSGGMISQNVGSGGELKIALRTDEPITQDGELLRVRFRVKGKQGDSCALTLDAAEAWEKESLFEVRTQTQPGTFTVSGLALPLPLPMLAAVGGGLLLLVLIALMLAKRRKRVPAPAPTAVAAGPPVLAPVVPVQGNSCPQCGAVVMPGDLFCGSCGRNMRTAPAVPPPSAPASRPQTPPPAGTNAPPQTSAAADEVMAGLKKLKEMQEAGLITAEDFERKKSDLLQRM